MRRNKVIGIALFIALVSVAGYLYDKYRIAPGIVFNNLQLEDLNGQAINLDSLKDKKLLLNFFKTWCGPCVREMPALEATANALGDNNYVLLCISDEPLERLQSFSTRTALHLRILHSTNPFPELKIFTFPTSYVLNLKREIAFKKVGDVDWTDTQVIQMLKGI